MTGDARRRRPHRCRHRDARKPILIYGDYDVDGTTAIVILKTAIELCGGTADFHVPHRIRDGYDLRDDVIERAAAAGYGSSSASIWAFAPSLPPKPRAASAST